VNTGWRNSSFRGFADYMQTDEFSEGLVSLEEMARKQPTVSCAPRESVALPPVLDCRCIDQAQVAGAGDFEPPHRTSAQAHFLP